MSETHPSQSGFLLGKSPFAPRKWRSFRGANGDFADPGPEAGTRLHWRSSSRCPGWPPRSPEEEYLGTADEVLKKWLFRCKERGRGFSGPLAGLPSGVIIPVWP